MSKLALSAGRPSRASKEQSLAALAGAGETAKVNFVMPVDEFVQLKMLCVRERTTIKDLLTGLIRERLARG